MLRLLRRHHHLQCHYSQPHLKKDVLSKKLLPSAGGRDCRKFSSQNSVTLNKKDDDNQKKISLDILFKHLNKEDETRSTVGGRGVDGSAGDDKKPGTGRAIRFDGFERQKPAGRAVGNAFKDFSEQVTQKEEERLKELKAKRIEKRDSLRTSEASLNAPSFDMIKELANRLKDIPSEQPMSFKQESSAFPVNQDEESESARPTPNDISGYFREDEEGELDEDFSTDNPDSMEYFSEDVPATDEDMISSYIKEAQDFNELGIDEYENNPYLPDEIDLKDPESEFAYNMPDIEDKEEEEVPHPLFINDRPQKLDYFASEEISQLLHTSELVYYKETRSEYLKKYIDHDIKLKQDELLKVMNPHTIAVKIEKLQEECLDILEAEDASIVRDAIPGIFRDYTFPDYSKTKTEEFLEKPHFTVERSSEMMKLFSSNEVNFLIFETFIAKKLGEMNEEGTLTLDYLLKLRDALHIPKSELIDSMVLDVDRFTISDDDVMDPQDLSGVASAVIGNFRHLGTAVRNYLSRDEQEVMELEQREDLEYLLAAIQKFAELLIDLTPSKFAQLFSIKAETLEPKEKNDIDEYLEYLDDAIEEKTPLEQELTHIASRHKLVVAKKLESYTQKFYEDGLQTQHINDMPYIRDVTATTSAGKYGTKRVLAPMERYFEDIIECVPEGTKRDQVINAARALGPVQSLTTGQKRAMLREIAEMHTQYDLGVGVPRTPIKRTHMHPNPIGAKDYLNKLELPIPEGYEGVKYR